MYPALNWRARSPIASSPETSPLVNELSRIIKSKRKKDLREGRRRSLALYYYSIASPAPTMYSVNDKHKAGRDLSKCHKDEENYHSRAVSERASS